MIIVYEFCISLSILSATINTPVSASIENLPFVLILSIKYVIFPKSSESASLASIIAIFVPIGEFS